MVINVMKDEAIQRAVSYTKGYVYIYGYKDSMNPVTERMVGTLSNQFPGTFTESYIKKALESEGGKAIDCSGLVCSTLGIPDYGSWQIRDFPNNFPKLFDYIQKPERGCICWKPGHVGFCVGNSKVVEARSQKAGVKVFDFYEQPWEKFIMPKYREAVYSKVGWIKEPDGRMWYAKSRKVGDFYKSGIYEIDGKLYMFDEQGFLLKVAVVFCNDNGEVEDTCKYYYES